MNKKTGRIWMWIGAITVALIALVAVWTELSGTERLETNSPGYQAGVAAYEEGDYATAIEKLQPFAEQGQAGAQYHLGLMYYYGQGVDKDEKEAAKWFRKAAEQEHPEAQTSLSAMYFYGQGVEEDEKEAVKWTHKAAEQGYYAAQYSLGVVYYHGRGVEEDKKEAAKWFHKAAEQGFLEAQHYLGVMYYYGQGVEADEKEAAKWFRKAAEQGHPVAQYSLGVLYYHGQGVEEDEKEAVKWFRKAAEQGDSEAQNYVNLIEAAIGKKAPDFTLQTLTGERFNLAEQRGRPVFLNFWATWCSPCLAEMPDIEKLQQTLGDSILIVGIDDEPADTVREFVQNRGYTWTFVLDPDNEVARTYNVSVIPTSVFIDAKGVIVRKFVGQKDYKTFLEAAREAINN